MFIRILIINIIFIIFAFFFRIFLSKLFRIEIVEIEIEMFNCHFNYLKFKSKTLIICIGQLPNIDIIITMAEASWEMKRNEPIQVAVKRKTSEVENKDYCSPYENVE